MSQSTKQFFDQLADDYTAAIDRVAPRYREMLWAILHYLPDDIAPRRILELGCGTGNLSLGLAATWPSAELQLVDISGDLLAECRQRLGDEPRFTFQQADFGEVEYPAESFDLVTSSIAIHHLTDAGKAKLLAGCHRWLRPSGWISFGDQMAASNAEAYQKHVDCWRQAAFELGSSQADWDRWMQHQTDHDHHATVAQHFQWLSAAGFSQIDCPWRYLLWTVVHANKQG